MKLLKFYIEILLTIALFVAVSNSWSYCTVGSLILIFIMGSTLAALIEN